MSTEEVSSKELETNNGEEINIDKMISATEDMLQPKDDKKKKKKGKKSKKSKKKSIDTEKSSTDATEAEEIDLPAGSVRTPKKSAKKSLGGRPTSFVKVDRDSIKRKSSNLDSILVGIEEYLQTDEEVKVSVTEDETKSTESSRGTEATSKNVDSKEEPLNEKVKPVKSDVPEEKEPNIQEDTQKKVSDETSTKIPVKSNAPEEKELVATTKIEESPEDKTVKNVNKGSMTDGQETESKRKDKPIEKKLESKPQTSASSDTANKVEIMHEKGKLHGDKELQESFQEKNIEKNEKTTSDIVSSKNKTEGETTKTDSEPKEKLSTDQKADKKPSNDHPIARDESSQSISEKDSVDKLNPKKSTLDQECEKKTEHENEGGEKKSLGQENENCDTGEESQLKTSESTPNTPKKIQYLVDDYTPNKKVVIGIVGSPSPKKSSVEETADISKNDLDANEISVKEEEASTKNDATSLQDVGSSKDAPEFNTEVPELKKEESKKNLSVDAELAEKPITTTEEGNAPQKEIPTPNKDSGNKKKDAIASEKDVLSVDKNTSTTKEDIETSKKDTLAPENDVPKKELSKEKEEAKQNLDEVPMEKDVAISKSNEEDSTSKKEIEASKKNAVPENDISTPKKEVAKSEKDITLDEKEAPMAKVSEEVEAITSEDVESEKEAEKEAEKDSEKEAAKIGKSASTPKKDPTTGEITTPKKIGSQNETAEKVTSLADQEPLKQEDNSSKPEQDINGEATNSKDAEKEVKKNTKGDTATNKQETIETLDENLADKETLSTPETVITNKKEQDIASAPEEELVSTHEEETKKDKEVDEEEIMGLDLGPSDDANESATPVGEKKKTEASSSIQDILDETDKLLEELNFVDDSEINAMLSSLDGGKKKTTTETNSKAVDSKNTIKASDIAKANEELPVYIFTSLAGGGFHMIPRTNRLATILTANRVKFEYRDLGTDDEARKVWKTYGRGRTLPGVVRGRDDIIGNWEEVEEVNESYGLRDLIYNSI